VNGYNPEVKILFAINIALSVGYVLVKVLHRLFYKEG
jgi:hypothetical protein